MSVFCLYICTIVYSGVLGQEKASNSLEQQSWMVESCHLGAGNWTHVLQTKQQVFVVLHVNVRRKPILGITIAWVSSWTGKNVENKLRTDKHACFFFFPLLLINLSRKFLPWLPVIMDCKWSCKCHHSNRTIQGLNSGGQASWQAPSLVQLFC